MKNTEHSKLTGTPDVASSVWLECGHPGEASNLIDGECGTCKNAEECETLAAKTEHEDFRECLTALAKLWRDGSMIYDTNGKNLLQWEQDFKEHSSDQGEGRAESGPATTKKDNQ